MQMIDRDIEVFGQSGLAEKAMFNRSQKLAPSGVDYPQKMGYSAVISQRESHRQIMTGYILCILLYVCTVSCENNDSGEVKIEHDPNRRVTLTSFYPAEGRTAERLLLDGDNFGSDPEKIKVYVNQKRASVVSANGRRIFAICPRMAGGDGEHLEVAVVVGRDSVIYDDRFLYNVSVSVTTIAGNGAPEFRAGTLAESSLRPFYVSVDDEDNVFVSIREGDYYGIARINENENIVTPLIMHSTNAVIRPNALCVDRKTGIYYVPCESASTAFYTLDPRDGWAPRRRLWTWRNLNGFSLPANATWKHSFGFCELDGYIYTRFFDGQVVKIHPRTFEADIIAMTPNGTCCGVTFHPLKPELLYMVGRSQGMSGGIYVIDVRYPDEPYRRLNPTGTGHRDGDISTALFRDPWQIYFDPEDGSLYVADASNHCIRRVRPDNFVETFLGMPGTSGWADGGKNEALFNEPRGITVSKDGFVYVADYGNNRIRKLSIE